MYVCTTSAHVLGDCTESAKHAANDQDMHTYMLIIVMAASADDIFVDNVSNC